MSNQISGNIQIAGGLVTLLALGEPIAQSVPVPNPNVPQPAQAQNVLPLTPGTTMSVITLTQAQSVAAGNNASPADGDYFFTSLPSGVYQLSAYAAGYVYPINQVVTILPSAPANQCANFTPVSASPAQGSNRQDHSNNVGRNYIIARG